MPVDDQDTGTTGTPPPAAANVPPRRTWRRRYITRRNAFYVSLVAIVGALVLLLFSVFLYRSGRVDTLIANQIISTLAEYGIRAEIKEFHTKLGPRTVEIKGLALYDAQSGAQLGRIDNIIATVRVADLYALSLRRNVNLEALEVNSPELWIAFDEQGNSNFRNLHLPPPAPNQRILFSYSTAQVKVNNGIIHYEVRRSAQDEQTGEQTRHVFAGEARNLRALIQPDDVNAPADSRANTVDLFMSDSTFAVDGQQIAPIDVEAHARVNQTSAEIRELTLRSPVAESHLQGTLDDWRAGRYQLQVRSTVDLTQISDTFKPATPLRGAGEFIGTVKGEGTQYKIEGDVKSDALAAGNVRLKGLQVGLNATGDGVKQYNAQGRAVVDLLTAGSFNLNLVQLRGGVMGSGSDFRFLGELRAAALRRGDTSIASLMLSDAVAEVRDGKVEGTAGRATGATVVLGDTHASGAQANGIRFSATDKDHFNATVVSLSTGAITNEDTRLNGLTARDVKVTGRGTVTDVATNDVRVNGGTFAGAQVGSINIAGVRLAIHDGGRVEGSTSDVNIGTVAFNTGSKGKGGTPGKVENVKLARPVFVLEKSDRYRVTADLSLGGGVLGDFQLGAARAAVVATNTEVQLNNFTAEALNGSARGSAVINKGRGASHVNAAFEGLDIGGLLAVLTGRAVPVTGATTGTVDLRFPGTDVQLASGNLTAQLTGETGNETSGRTPINGTIMLTAERGNFQLSQANLRAGASELNATGQFAFAGDSNLQVHLASTDASELQRIVVTSGLVPALEEKLSDYGIDLAGNLAFDGTVRGQLNDPLVNGRASLGSLVVNGRDLGALSASIATDANAINISDGKLAQADGGSAQFALNIPRVGTDNVTLDATLQRVDIGNLLAAIPSGQKSNLTAQLAAAGPTSGRVHINGIPGALSGDADLRAGPGVIKGEPFDEIALKATFSGTSVNLENLNARFRAGTVNAKGTYDIDSSRFDLNAQGTGVKLDVLAALTGATGTPNLGGTFDFTATANGLANDARTYQIDLNGTGRDVTINGQTAGTLALVGRTEGQRFNLQLTTGILGQPQVIAASVDLSKEELPTTIETTLTNVDLTPLFAALMPNADVRVTGRATGSLRASGNLFGENAEGEQGFTLAGLRGTAQFSQLVVQVADVQLAAVDPLMVTFTPDEITFDKTQFTGPGTNVVFGGTAALAANGRQNFTVDGDLNLRVLNSLSRNVFLDGAAKVGVRVAGTFAQPSITGTASVANAAFSLLLQDQRLRVSQINGDVRFTADRAQLDSLTGRLGGGTITVNGGAALAGFSLAKFQLNVLGEQITVPFPQDFRSTADANLVVQGDLQTQLIRGTVNLRRAEYTKDIELADLINRRPETTISEGGGAGGFTVNTQLDLTVEGRDALVVRNNIADAVGSVALQIRGMVDDPIVGGRVTATRGTLSFRNDRYELTRAFIDLPMRREADPILNIQAESEIKGYRVIVNLTGPLSSPNAAVSSDPALPQADVVALVTTGNLSSSEEGGSTLAQTGLGTATSLLTDAIINAPVQRATDKLFGLNRFELDPLIAGRGGASPTARLTVGRQINRNLSLTYSTNVTTEQNQVVALEYRLSDRLSFVAQYQQGAINTLRTQNNNFSFEIRFRKRF